MAPTFGRSISFPLSPARSSSSKYSKHVRSTSLPSCRAPHPLLAHLRTQTAAARAWSTSPAATPASGLARIAALHAALADLLRLPEPQASVRASDDRLLHAFLLLADAHQGFQEALLALRSGAADARAALRRRDATALASGARSRRRTDKEIARIAADVARCARQLGSGSAAAAGGEETEMAAALADAAAASAAASAAVFSAVASMSAAAASSSSSKKSAVFAAAFAKAKAAPETADVAPEKLEELERCVDECETGSETVFRSIVQTRVTLLNICTPAI